MRHYKAVVYRNYEILLEFDHNDIPEMTDPEGKAEWLSRSKDIGEWRLGDVSTDIYEVSEV